jgi:polyhydroxyalkanoate synthesis regulator phasin
MSTTDSVQKFARNVWLAGLGAYGKGAQTVTETLDKAYVESNQLFNDLVDRGTEIQTSLEAKLKQQSVFERKVDEVRDKLGLNQDISDEQIDALSAKVDALTEIVAELAQKRLAEATAESKAATKAEAKVEAKADSEAKEKPVTRTRKPRATKADA